MDNPPLTLLDAVAAHAARIGDRRALVFLRNGEIEDDVLTYHELHVATETTAAHLRDKVAPGDRVLLAYPQGLDFLVAFLACLRAGVVAVPVSPPSRQRGTAYLDHIVRDSGAVAILSSADLLTKTRPTLVHAAGMPPLISTDGWRGPGPLLPQQSTDVDAIAFLQYTSGSTGSPRGVVVRHRNLLANLIEIKEAFGHGAEEIIVSWLPMFHDMGLGTLLQGLWLGGSNVLMSPAAFLQKPMRWLRAVSTYRSTTSGGPNFAYDLCTRNISETDRASIDLSGWRVAFNGAEPVRAATLERFSRAFAPSGFRRSAFYPVYGLAEATLFVTGGNPGCTPVTLDVSEEALRQHRVVVDTDDTTPLVSCGSSRGNAVVRVVDPQTCRPCAAREIGEIWVTGPSVADGYWSVVDGNFGATLEPPDGRAYLRTGDLGFTSEGGLFVTGRLKDLIIVRGRNHYPQDLEDSACTCDPSVHLSGAAAFAVSGPDGEVPVLAVEVERRDIHGSRHDEIVAAVRRVIAERHGLMVHDVLLLRPGALPRTTSGKVRRADCRAVYLENPATALHRLNAGPAAQEARAAGPASEALTEWLRRYAAERINSRVIDERRTIPPYIALDFGNRGLLGMRGGATYGGLALPHADCARVIEQLAAIDLTLSLFVGLHNYLGVAPIERHGTPEMRASLLPALVTGRELTAFALTEPGAGSNPRAIATVAEPDGERQWRLRGEKSWCGAAAWAGAIIVFARHAETDPRVPGKVSGFVVRQGTPGLRQGPEALTMGMRGLIQNTVYLEGVRVSEQDLLGTLGDGMSVAHEAMMEARFGIAAACLGAMKRALQLGHRYASCRPIATGLLLDHPVTRERLEEAVHATAALASLVAGVGAALDRGVRVPQEIFAACKCLAPEMLWDVADDLVQLLGGRGYIETNMAPQILRDARVFRIFEGPTETMRAFLGARLQLDAETLLHALREIFGAPRATAQLQRALTAAAGGEGEPLLVQARLGSVAAAAVLAAAVEGTPEEPWARARFDAAVQAMATIVMPMDTSSLASRIFQLTQSIGGSSQHLPGENHERDPLLSDPAPTVAGTSAAAEGPRAIVAPNPGRSRESIRDWLVVRLARTNNNAHLDSARPLAEQGIDSLAVVELMQDLSDWLGRPLEDTLLWNYPTIDALAAHLEGQTPVPSPSPIGMDPDRSLGGSIDEAVVRLEQLLRTDT